MHTFIYKYSMQMFSLNWMNWIIIFILNHSCYKSFRTASEMREMPRNCSRFALTFCYLFCSLRVFIEQYNNNRNNNQKQQ